jgi:hypothetical protein
MAIKIDQIKKGQVWRLVKIQRGNVVISHVNTYNDTIYWHYEGFESSVMDSPLERFVEDFTPVDPSILKSDEPPEKPFTERDFLI